MLEKNISEFFIFGVKEISVRIDFYAQTACTRRFERPFRSRQRDMGTTPIRPKWAESGRRKSGKPYFGSGRRWEGYRLAKVRTIGRGVTISDGLLPTPTFQMLVWSQPLPTVLATLGPHPVASPFFAA